MAAKSKLFEDIFQLQNTFPEEIDPEDPEDGFKSGLTEGATEVQDVGSTQLKKRTALILDDPKYRGKRTSRKDLYSDEESQDSDNSRDVEDEESMEEEEGDESEEEENSEGESGDDSGSNEEDDEEDDEGNMEGEEDEEFDDSDPGEKKDATILPPSDTNEKEKGKAVSYQLGLWDDLIKCRISLQKMFSLCNRLPTPDVWDNFSSYPSFKKELPETENCINQTLGALLELQEVIQAQVCKNSKDSKGEGGDEEITSEESEVEEEKDDQSSKKKEPSQEGDAGNEDDNDEEKDDDDDEMECDDDDGGDAKDKEEEIASKTTKKRSLESKDAEKMLSKRHKSFQSFRNKTLAKWDEKTRLTHATVKSKNFAAFDISVMKQIQQVLANKSRLIKRIHQNRSSVRILGHVDTQENQTSVEVVVEDDEDEVEVRQRSTKCEVDMNPEIIDDQDFYQMLLRDFIVLKQNEETDPVMANKHWLEIQNLRKKQKRKVDTRASKGRKIRYHVKEKLKNFMAPYDKSTWSDEQKDDLFKSLFGGKQSTESNSASTKEREEVTINIGL